MLSTRALPHSVHQFDFMANIWLVFLPLPGKYAFLKHTFVCCWRLFVTVGCFLIGLGHLKGHCIHCVLVRVSCCVYVLCVVRWVLGVRALLFSTSFRAREFNVCQQLRLRDLKSRFALKFIYVIIQWMRGPCLPMSLSLSGHYKIDIKIFIKVTTALQRPETRDPRESEQENAL